MRIVIGEDEALLREGLQMLLAADGFEVVATAGDAPAMVRAVDDHRPDLLITDIRMPPTHHDDGLRAAIELRARHPELAVMVVSQHVQRPYAMELLGTDTRRVGYLLKQRIADAGQFRADLRQVAAGGTVLDPEVVSVMMNRASRDQRPVDRLTPRQREVLALVAEGRSNAAIAARLVISEKAVVQHVSNIYDVLGIPQHEDDHRRVLAVLQHLGGRDGG